MKYIGERLGENFQRKKRRFLTDWEKSTKPTNGEKAIGGSER